MRIAFLILAHHQPTMLRRLIERISSETSYIFIHLDLKARFSDFEISTRNLSRVTYLPDPLRVSVNWGGYSIISATLNLVNYAIKSDIEFSRFCLLSGNDYPLRTIEFIKKEFQSDAQFIQIQRRLDFDGDTSFDRRARRIFLGDTRLTNPRTCPPFLNRIMRKIESLVSRNFPADIELYYGSQWWSLTGDAIREILSVVSARPRIIGWFRWTVCPDELFFQTLLKLTKFSNNIAYDYHEAVTRPDTKFDSMHYIDWFAPNAATPKVLDLTDLGDLKESKALFARKFDELTSFSLIKALDNEVGL